MSEEHDFDPSAEEDRATGAKARAEQEARWEIEDLAWLLSSKRGRRVMWRLLTNAGVYRLSYTQGDASATAFNEGQRNLGLRLLSLIMTHCSEAYASMVQERTNVRS